METILTRLKQYADFKGLSIRQLESKIGASNGVINNAIKKGTDIQSKWISIIIDTFTDLNPMWLIIGNGEMIKSSSSDTGDNKSVEILLKMISEKDQKIESLVKTIALLENKVEELKKDNPKSSYRFAAEP